MIWVFPMAGLGTRVRELGRFKPFVPVLGKPVLRWCLDGLGDDIAPTDKCVFVTTKAFEAEFGVRAALDAIFEARGHQGPVELVLADDTPPGPAASVHLSAPHLDPDSPVTVVNCDQLIHYDTRELGPDEGLLPVYVNPTGSSSYVTIENGLVTGIYEKELVSYYASAGVYALGRSADLIGAIEHAFSADLRHKGEFYVGPALNWLIEQGRRFYPGRVSAKHDLGTANEIARFERQFARLMERP